MCQSHRVNHVLRLWAQKNRSDERMKAKGREIVRLFLSELGSEDKPTLDELNSRIRDSTDEELRMAWGE